MKKVLHVLWNAKFGGIERLVLALANEQFESDNLSVSVLIAQKEGELLHEFLNAKFETIFGNLSSGWDINPLRNRRLKKLFSQFDIIHLHFFNPIIFSSIPNKKQVVFTEHGNFGFGRKKKRSDRLLNSLKRYYLNKANVYLTFNSNFTSSFATQVYLKPSNQRHQVVLNGIDFKETEELAISNFRTSKATEFKDMLEGKFVIGTSSRFAGFKRIDRLIDAFAKIKEKDNTRLLLVGDGVLKSQLEKQVTMHGIEDYVIFTAYVDKVREVQELMDVCVFPSQNEPFGLVAIETLSIGKPTLVFEDGGGLVEIISGIEKEDIVSSISALTKRLEYYKTNKVNKQSIESKKAYAKTFSIKRMNKEFEEIYMMNQ